MKPAWRFLRHSVGPVDQVLISVSNLLLSVGVASQSGVDTFGEFAILYSIGWLSIGLARAVAGETALSATKSNPDGLRNGPVYIAAAVGLLAAGAAALVGATFGLELVLMGAICLPAVVVQDTSRYVSFSLRKAGVALFSDAARLVIMLLLALVGSSLGVPSSTAWIAAWGISAFLSALIPLAKFRLGRSPQMAIRWARSNRRLSASVGAEFVVNTGVGQAVILLMPLFSSLGSLATLKVAQVAVGPLNTLLTSLGLLLLPILFRLGAERKNTALRKYFLLSVTIIAAGSMIYAGLIAVAPEELMAVLFGASWAGALPIVMIVAAQTLLTGVTQVGGYVIRAVGRASLTARMRAFTAPAALGLPLAGAALWGASGAAWGLFATSFITTTIWLVPVLRMTRRGDNNDFHSR